MGFPVAERFCSCFLVSSWLFPKAAALLAHPCHTEKPSPRCPEVHAEVVTVRGPVVVDYERDLNLPEGLVRVSIVWCCLTPRRW